MSEDVVLFDELPATGGLKVGKITLNVPRTLNSLTLDMVELLLGKLQEWEADTSIACLLVTGSGEKAFCAGGDVQALHASAVKTPGGPCLEAETFFCREYRMDFVFHNYSKPVLVWGDGIVMGGGLGIFAAGSHRIVTETSRFAMPEVTIALFPDVGGSYFLNRTPGQSGRFLALTGASFNAADAIYLGIADFFITRESYKALESALVKHAPATNGAMTSVLEHFAEASSTYQPAGHVESHQFQIDELCAAERTIDVVNAFRALETDDRWLSKAAQGLLSGSPLAVLWIDEQLKRTQSMMLSDVFRSELLLATNIVRYPEFAEGVRALLIDKDRQPDWQFANVESVDGDFIERFFVSPWENNPLKDL